MYDPPSQPGRESRVGRAWFRASWKKKGEKNGVQGTVILHRCFPQRGTTRVTGYFQKVAAAASVQDGFHGEMAELRRLITRWMGSSCVVGGLLLWSQSEEGGGLVSSNLLEQSFRAITKLLHCSFFSSSSSSSCFLIRSQYFEITWLIEKKVEHVVKLENRKEFLIWDSIISVMYQGLAGVLFFFFLIFEENRRRRARWLILRWLINYKMKRSCDGDFWWKEKF